MDTLRHFATCRGFTVQLHSVKHSIEGSTGACPRCGDRHVVDRTIDYKATPSRHRCDARCEDARGHDCECACGGVNHGKGAALVVRKPAAMPLFAAAF